MQLGSSQIIQSSNPLDTSSARRVNNTSRPSSNPAANSESDDKESKQMMQSEQQMLRDLRARDREVRAHEAAHMAAGGSLVRGGPSYTYQQGPDGRAYAIGGEVKLDVSGVPSDPEATLDKADQIRAAALAPANPSPQDLRVAANANQLAARARIDIAVQRREEAVVEAEQRSEEGISEPDTVASATDSDEAANTAQSSPGSIDSAPPSPVVAPEAPVANTADLATNTEPAAPAISAFMSTAETEPVPVRFNQFV